MPSLAFRILRVITLPTALLALVNLLPDAGGMPASFSSTIPFTTMLWFVAILAGPLLLLMSGLRLVMINVRPGTIAIVTMAIVLIAGCSRLITAGYHEMSFSWLGMVLVVSVLMFASKSEWTWGIVGGFLSAVIMGFSFMAALIFYFTASAPHVSAAPLLDLIGAVAALVCAVCSTLIKYRIKS